MAFEIGAYGYLIKPFTENEICITLAGALRRRELEVARRSHLRGLERTVSRLTGVQAIVSSLATAALSPRAVARRRAPSDCREQFHCPTRRLAPTSSA